MSPSQSIYLVLIDDSQNKRRFWEAIQRGRHVLLRWGRLETAGQQKLLSFDTAVDAEAEYISRVDAKRQEGYGSEQRPADAEVPGKLLDMALASKPYSLTWKITGKPVTNQLLREVAAAVDAVLLVTGRFEGMQAEWVSESTHGHIRLQAGAQTVCFGFPPQKFVDGLPDREAQSLMNGTISRDGWLSMNGAGNGILFTGYKAIDFPVRLMLTILKARCMNEGIEVSARDTLGECIESDFRLSEQALLMDWFEHWPFFENALAEHGWLYRPMWVRQTSEQTEGSVVW